MPHLASIRRIRLPHIENGTRRRYSSTVMLWPTRRGFALLLAAFVAAGLSLSVVQAGSMAVKMDMSASMDMSHGGDCAGCPDDSIDGKGMVACPSLCVMSAVGLAPQAPALLIAVFPARLSPHGFSLLRGQHTPPDPYPPRAGNLA